MSDQASDGTPTLDLSDHLKVLEAAQRPQFPYELGSFRAAVWETLRVRDTLELLLDPRPSFVGHKEVAFKALVAWIIYRKRPSVRQRAVQAAIALSIVEQIELAEKDVLESGLREVGAISDYIIRMGRLGVYFLPELYYACGGMNAIRRAPASGGFKTRLQNELYFCQAPMTVMRVLHHAHDNLRSLNHRAPSLFLINSAISGITRKKNPTQRTADSHWAYHRDNISLVYAADRITLGRGGSLLSAFASGTSTFKRHGHYLRELVSSASWVCRHLFTGHFADVGLENLKNLPTMPEQEPAAGALPAYQISAINQLLND